MSDDIGNPMHEGAGDLARRTAQLAAAAMAAVQLAIRVHAQRAATQDAKDQEAIERAESAMQLTRAEARMAWTPGLEPGFTERATTAEAMTVWSAAGPWRDEDPGARDAAALAEERLNVLHPDVMAEYREYTEAGLDPSAAMLEAGRTVSRAGWKDVLDPQLRDRMSVDDTLKAWAAARPWAAAAPQPEGLWSPRSEEAAVAMGEAEAHLRALRPEAMADYDEARAFGADPMDAMRDALPQLRKHVWQDEVAPPAALGDGNTATHAEAAPPEPQATSRLDRAYPATIDAALANTDSPTPAPTSRPVPASTRTAQPTR